MKKEKIGIITLYYNSLNYGGIAQAYALNKYFENLGYDSEMISYQVVGKKDKKKYKLFEFIIKAIKKVYDRVVIGTIENIIGKKYKPLLKIRAERISQFRDAIPHSSLYDLNNISNCEKKYEIFVTGSDQSWKPALVDDALLFNFVKDKNKKIFSYSSSIAVNYVDDKYIEFMKKSLGKYNAISVRETQAKELLKPATAKKIEVVVDPTQLLNVHEWNSITSNRLIEDEYVFCYMLGESKKIRKEIVEFSKKERLKLVTIPFIKDGNKYEFKLSDYKFGDIQEFNIGFEDFLSLVKNAKYVLTDSFHAISFSFLEQAFFHLLCLLQIWKIWLLLI